MPSAGDWSTTTVPGGATDVTTTSGLDAAVEVLAASSITTQIPSDPGNPPGAQALATWSSSGLYVQTRPTGVKMSVLMATLVNNTGTNLTVLNVSYNFTNATTVSENVFGHRVYYSFSGAANSWVNIPALNSPAAGQVSASVVLSSAWNTGTSLYLLWADDNGPGSPDDANQIDNFFVSGYYTNFPLSIALTAPANNQHFGTGSGIPVALALTGSPTNVSYYLDNILATNRTAAPFTPVTLPAQSIGSHTIYATAQDESSELLTTVTNTFQVDASISGTLSGNTTLYASNSPCLISGNLTVPNGVTLTIEAGTTVNLSSGVSVTVANGGRIIAEGTSNAPIAFTRATSGAPAWGGITINGAVGSPETRFVYAYFEGNNTLCIEVAAGTVYLEHCSFGTTTHQYLALDGASFIVSACHFPSGTTQFELVHGTGGIKSGGHGIVRDCFFGSQTGYNDLMDFTGGNRERGQPIIQYYNNVFLGSGDDELDLDGTDAWVEGNIFLHTHKNGSPDSSSGVSGGSYGSDTSQVTIIGNIFYDCDQAAMAKEGDFYTMINNTIVHQSHAGGTDTYGAVVCLEDGGVPEGAGMYLEGNIIYDAEDLTRNLTNAIVTFTNNIICQLQGTMWSGPGGNNTTNDPTFNYVPQLSETYFTNWAQAQVMWSWFSLLPGSPGIGSGPNGRDKGGVIPYGVSVSGEPVGSTTNTAATLMVGINRRGNGIPTTGWPNGSGFTHYQWRLDTNAWSAETSITNPIVLTNLAIGTHLVEVIGKNDAGFYQNDPALGTDAAITTSGVWTVHSPNQLRFSSIETRTNTCILTFEAEAGNTYSVLSSDTLVPANWNKVTDVPAPGTNGPVEIIDPGVGSQTMRFYKLVSPAQ